MGKSIIEVASIEKLGMPLMDTDGAIINIANFQPEYPLYVLNTKEEILTKHGMLDIIGVAGRFAEMRSSGKPRYRLAVLAKCDCGELLVASYKEVFTGNTKSCGCLRRETTRNRGKLNKRLKMHTGEFVKELVAEKKKEERHLIKRYRDYMHNAKKREIAFTLTLNDFEIITSKPCSICKENLLGYTGIDRINSTKGYEVENIQPCCTTCNMMKSNYSEEFFKERIELLYKNYVINNN